MNDLPFIEKMKRIQCTILDFVEKGNDAEENYENIFNILRDEKIDSDRNEFQLFLSLLYNISTHHFRNSFFMGKIEKILIHYFDVIQRYYTNDEIFHFFRKNKRILLFLIDKNIIKINDKISSIMMESFYKSSKYPEYFYTEIKDLVDFEMKKIPKNFDERRKVGENHYKVCFLVRNDLIDEFIIYVKENNITLDYTIRNSFFETNSFLLNKKPKLIEYAAFCGSIQIFKYLYVNKVELTPSLWIYGIHGNNLELIKILEENKILPENDNYIDCFLEAIKCHHIKIANYIHSNHINENKMDSKSISKFEKKIFTSSFRYHNYFYFPNDLNQKIFFFLACEYDYFKIVEIYFKTKQIDLNLKLILTLIFFKIKFYIYSFFK